MLDIPEQVSVDRIDPLGPPVGYDPTYLSRRAYGS